VIGEHGGDGEIGDGGGDEPDDGDRPELCKAGVVLDPEHCDGCTNSADYEGMKQLVPEGI
jgi:hypothetical protein